MRFPVSALSLALAALPSLALARRPIPNSLLQRHAGEDHSSSASNSTVGVLDGDKLVNYGMLLFPTYDFVDVTSAIEALHLVAYMKQALNLYIISPEGGLVSMAPVSAGMNKFNSSFWPEIKSTHSVAEAMDLDIDVLIVPGGPGARNINGTQPLVDFIKAKYPSVDYMLTICTGAGIAARSGVMDGRNATTNKKAWETIRAMGPNVNWIAPARYIRDGNIWSSSGVTAGFDMMYEFIGEKYGQELNENIHNTIEYEPNPSDYDPFTDLYNITHTA